ncbi:MAG TPA: UGSC family (seleno)protein [Burkholderiales bacterium]|nr:UGSC family (seleno)protein [Burkholderiales bacterium]
MQKVTVLNPRIADDAPRASLAPELKALAGARVAFVDNSKVNADLFLSRIRPLLEQTYGVRPGRTVRKLAPKDELTHADLEELASYDAVVQCFGDCGTSTSMTVADGVSLERLGIPTVTVISTAFARAARAQAAGRGMGDLPVIEVPHPMHTAPAPVVLERAEAVVSDLVGALTRRNTTSIATREELRDAEVTLDASPEAVQEFFFEQGWTDGLPVAPPTHAAVRAMLAAVRRDAAQEIGPIPPRMRMASLEKLAVNAVMAGCRPEYFPVVLAAIEAMLDPECRLYGIRTATNNGTPLVIVNGPAARKLDINSGGNVFGQGWRANATIGRALQLVLRNAGGDMPGETDMSTQGQPGKFTFCIAENEEDSPWTPFHVERGFSPDDSTVTVIGASAGHNVFTYGCETGTEILEHVVGAMTALGHNNVIFPTGPLVVFGPEHANVLARDGYDKPKIREYLFRHARIPLSRFRERTVRGLKHRRARWFEQAGDPDHIGVADDPSHINIVVAGGPGIHSQFVPTSFSYSAVTRRIAD